MEPCLLIALPWDPDDLFFLSCSLTTNSICTTKCACQDRIKKTVCVFFVGLFPARREGLLSLGIVSKSNRIIEKEEFFLSTDRTSNPFPLSSFLYNDSNVGFCLRWFLSQAPANNVIFWTVRHFSLDKEQEVNFPNPDWSTIRNKGTFLIWFSSLFSPFFSIERGKNAPNLTTQLANPKLFRKMYINIWWSLTFFLLFWPLFILFILSILFSRFHVFTFFSYFFIISSSLLYHFFIISLSFLYHFFIISLSFLYHFFSFLYHFFIISLSFLYHFFIISLSFLFHFFSTSFPFLFYFPFISFSLLL